MAGDIQQLLDELEDELNAARRVTLGSGVVVDRRRLLDIVEQLRLAIPTSIRLARDILDQREQAIAEAEAEAGRIVADAEREAEERISQAAVTRAAQERAHQVDLEAQERIRRMYAAAQADAERQLAEAAARAHAQERDADRYALAVISGLEERVNGFLVSLRQARAQFGNEEG